MKVEYDVIVVGNGLVGAAMVSSLAGLGLKVALCQQTPVTTQAPKDWRPLSLHYASVQILKTLSIWNQLPSPVVPIQQVMVNQQHRFGSLCFKADELKVPFLGAVVSFDELLAAFNDRAQLHSVPCYLHKIDSIKQSKERVCLNYHNDTGEHTVSAQLLIAADGAQSHCRQLLGIGVRETKVTDSALTFSLELDGAHQNGAWQRFTRHGTMAIVPMEQSNVLRLVWTCDNHYAQIIQSWSPAQMRDYLNSVYAGYIPTITHIKPLAQFPLSVSVAKQQASGRCLLMGNAARTFYPITAQGFNLALGDVAVLAQLITQAIQDDADVGAHTVLAEYHRWRDPMQKRMLRLTQSTGALFQLQLPALASIRGLGLAAIDLLPVLKTQLGRQLLGLSDRVPDLALGVALND